VELHWRNFCLGTTVPSGRLPISIEKRWEDNAVHVSYYPNGKNNEVRYTEAVFVGYRHFDKSTTKPQFPFGYGLSYTTFSYGGLNVSSSSTGVSVMVSFDVTNAGKRAAAEVAQVYVGDRHSGVPRPVKELKGFTKVFLNPGESRRVSVSLDRRAFSYYDVVKHAWTVTPASSTSTLATHPQT
jgi:beta-glucosidase